MKTICLTGMMGSGKSTTGKLLSQKLNTEFFDIDSLIEENEGMKISEIFKQKGENYFREIEKTVISSVLRNENQIISLGGGAFENKYIRELLLENSIVIYLKTLPETIFERIKNDTSRPLLCDNMSVIKIEEILKNREQNYKSATITINTDNKSPNEIVEEVIGAIKNGSKN